MPKIVFPVAQMAGAEWNILDSTGCRIAVCGYDNDHEKSGPAIAQQMVDHLNLADKLLKEARR